MSKTPEKLPGDPKTTGHSWDGIEEFDNPMPRWWLWTFYATIFWGVIYTIMYPAWPLVQSATAGVTGLVLARGSAGGDGFVRRGQRAVECQAG